MKKVNVTLNRRVGFSILEISKFLLYDFLYNYIKSRYGARAQLLLTDTDNLTDSIETEDLYTDMKAESNRFEFSAYPRTHTSYYMPHTWLLYDSVGGMIQSAINASCYFQYGDIKEFLCVNFCLHSI